MVALEIAVCDVDGMRAAASGGADRVELSSALELGGLTPSLGLIEACVAASPLPVHVLVRPRPGDFVLDDDLLAVAERDVRAAVAAGASGVVVGAARPDGTLDLDALARLRSSAGDATVTLHRVFDIVVDRSVALDALIALGFDRVLTSAGAERAADAVDALATLVAKASGRLQIVAGGGVRADDVPALVRAGVDGVHASARRAVATGPSGPGGGASGRLVTDLGQVRGLRTALDAV